MKPQPLQNLPTKTFKKLYEIIYNKQIIFNITITTAKKVSRNPKVKIQKGKFTKKLSRQNTNYYKSPKSHIRSDLPKLNKFSFIPKKTIGKYWPDNYKFIF